jgi:DNA relaxase NicK
MTTLNCKLDWFSFTFPFQPTGEKDNEHLLPHVLLAFHDFTAHRYLGVVTNSLWQWEKPSGFYPFTISCPTTSLRISFGGTSGSALVSLSGKACDAVLRYLSLRDIALSSGGRATRIDLATDLETDVSPSAFAESRTSKAFKTQGTFTSETGETVYIGSRQSERFCRVYRYSPPHPRSKYLRVEIECKGDFAKNVCNQLLSTSLTETTLSVNLPYGWSHPIWDTNGATVSKIPARAYDGDGANTLRWLEQTVVPAIKKASEAGLIDIKEWLIEHFRGDLL